MTRFIACLPLLLAIAAPATGQTPADTTLDFLAGDWTLYDAAGKPVGSSHIVAEFAGSMLFEQRVTDGQPPQPLWFANSERDGGWTELFVGPAGKLRAFPPASAPGAWPMLFASDVTLQDGTLVRFKLTMTRAGDDRSRRTLEMSRDKGATWSTVFDLDYRRKKPS